METFSYTTTAGEDAVLAWELARRTKVSKTPPKDTQALLTLEVAHLLRSWAAERKALAIDKLQNNPTSLTVEDKAVLGI